MERGVFGQRSVGPEFVIVVGIRGQDPAQVRVALDHDVVQTLSPRRKDFQTWDGSPRRRPCTGDSRLRDREAQLEQLTVDARRG